MAASSTVFPTQEKHFETSLHSLYPAPFAAANNDNCLLDAVVSQKLSQPQDGSSSVGSSSEISSLDSFYLDHFTLPAGQPLSLVPEEFLVLDTCTALPIETVNENIYSYVDGAESMIYYGMWNHMPEMDD